MTGKLALVLSAAILGGCANVPVNSAPGTSSVRCQKTDSHDPYFAKDMDLLNREFEQGAAIPAQDAPDPLKGGRSVTVWNAKNKGDTRVATVTNFGDGQVCISANFHLY